MRSYYFFRDNTTEFLWSPVADVAFEIRVDARSRREIPKGQTAYLIVIVPEQVQFVDIFPPRLVFAYAGVIEVEGGYFADHESLDIRGVSACRDFIRASADFKLAHLIAVALHENEKILGEIRPLLSQPAFHDLAVAFRHFHFSPSASPVKNRYLETYFHHLVVFER